jgi:outer membrane protein assembly factor BamB
MAGNGGPGYTSPLLLERGGAKRYVYFGGGKLNCIDPDGKPVWSQDWPRGETSAMPLFVPPDSIFGSGAEGVGSQLFRIVEVDGMPAVQQRWKSDQMRIHFNAGVKNGEHIYAFDNATLKCIAVEDASTAWVKRGLGKGSLIQADGRLYVLSDSGKLVLVEATPQEYREKGSVQALEGKTWTAPTLSGGKLYLRNHSEMVAYDVKG